MYNPNPQTHAEIDNELAEYSDERLRRMLVDVPNADWQHLTDQERKSLRARNELARRERERTRQAEADARMAKVAAARELEALEQVEQFKRQAQRAFPGTSDQFESAWPELLKQWQVQQTLARLSSDSDMAARRALYDSLRPE